MILENLILVIGLISLGTLAKKSGRFPTNTADVLNVFILNISLPAIILVSIPKLNFDSTVFLPVGMHWTAFTLHLLVLFIVSKVFKFSKSVFGALLIVTTLGNTAFLGIPMINAFIGSEAVPYGVLYDQLGSGIGFILFTGFVLPYFVGKETGDLKNILKGLLKFPPFVALILGFIFIKVPMPGICENFFLAVSKTLIPCAMIAVGFQMKYRLPKSTLVPLVVGLSLKLILLPLIMLSFVIFFDMGSSLAIKASVLQSGMPPMITAGALVISEGLEEDLSTSLVGYGLLFSFLTLSALNHLL